MCVVWCRRKLGGGDDGVTWLLSAFCFWWRFKDTKYDGSSVKIILLNKPTELLSCNNVKSNGRSLWAFCRGSRGDADFWFSLQKHVIPAALYSSVNDETQSEIQFRHRETHLHQQLTSTHSQEEQLFSLHLNTPTYCCEDYDKPHDQSWLQYYTNWRHRPK